MKQKVVTVKYGRAGNFEREIDIKGYALPGICKGLVAHKSIVFPDKDIDNVQISKSRWTITHEKSGFAIMFQNIPTLTQAHALAVQASQMGRNGLVDWTCEPNEIYNSILESRHRSLLLRYKEWR